MNKYISILALLALPACLGGGTGDEVDLTPSAPSVTMNNDFGTLMNGVRTTNNTSADPLIYDARLGRAAQLHANDMIDRNYFLVTIPGTVGNNNGFQDIGDRITAQRYTWDLLAQLIAQGDYTLGEALTEFGSETCDASGLEACIDNEVFVNFGIAKAGAGDGQKWVLVLTSPG